MSARTTFHPQPHSLADMSQFSDAKRRLVQMMDIFTTAGDRVNPTEDQLDLAGQLVRSRDQSRYTKVPFGSIIRQNQGQDGQMEMMVTAFDVLFRYTVNMLKLKRPRNWHTIKFSNAQFKARADCMIGTRYILKLMGYTHPTFGENRDQIGLSYPEPAVVDHEMIKIVGTELLTAKVEVKAVQEHGGRFSYPLPLSDVQLDTSRVVQPPRNPQLDGDLYTSMSHQQPPQQFGAGGSMSSGSYGSSQYSASSHQGISQNSSFQPPSTGTDYQHGNQLLGSSYGQGSVQPHSNISSYNTQPHNNQQYDYQRIDPYSNPGYVQGREQPRGNQQVYYNQRSNESGYQSYHQSNSQSSKTVTSTDGMESFSQPSSSEQPQSTAAKLAALRKKKEGILQNFNQPAQGDSSAYPPFTTSQSSVEQPVSNMPPSTNAAVQTKPPPVAPRTKLHVLTSNAKHSEEALHEDTSQAQKVPAPVQKRGPRTMVECDFCGFLNHESCKLCVDCENSRSESWRKVQMPSRGGSTDKPPPHNKALNNQPPPLHNESPQPPKLHNKTPLQITESEAHNFHSEAAALPNAQYDGQPNSVGNSQLYPPSGSAGASGTTPQRELKDFVPAVKYTPEEKEAIRKQQEREMMMERQQDTNGGGAETTPLTSFVPRNDNYNWDDGVKRTGNALFDVPEMTGPDNAQWYKDLGNKGHVLIQDVKEGLRRGFNLEEIRLATQLEHKYHSPCDFLSREWHNYIERTVFQAGQYSDEEHRKRRMNGSIGRPNRKEIVKVLIEEGGDCDRAAHKCCSNRMNMIQKLMAELKLPQSQAVFALEKNGLDVEKAIHAVYYEKIHTAQLYDYIWGDLEGGGIRQVQNEKVGQMIKQEQRRDHYLHRLLMAEYKMPSTSHCEVLVHLVRECNLTLGACLDVAKMNDDVETAKRLLTQECPICSDQFTRDKMVNMVHCDHAVCKDCFIGHFNIMIGEKSIKHFNCMLCAEPDMSSETIDMDLYLQLFSGLVQAHLSKEIYDMFTQKVNEQAMTKNDNFRWCIKCTTGFISELGRQLVQCPNATCGQQMCFQCKKPWEKAHDGLSCEQFAKWEIDNDPELQAQGLAAYLNEEGIECPSCGFKYALAKGGCMHFKCTQCPAEFCSGCGGLFKKDCTKYESCRARGLHAHHPRDCLSFLRDESVDDLQKLLTDNNVQFDIEPPEGQVMAEANKEIQALQGQAADDADQPALPVAIQPVAAQPVLKCRVMLQKENPGGAPMDEECGNPVQSGHAGLCERHYKEYLVYKVNQNNIDPLPLCQTPGQLQAILRRDEIKIPDQNAGEGEEEYCERLRQYISEKLPLEKRKVLNF